jgi:phenylacetate-coenzyme A ligase PaaK-like adenylate-forming protein
MCVERYQVHTIYGPNFGYALVGRKIRESGKKFNLSTLKWIDIAAEPISKNTIEALIKDWGVSPNSIYHSYGMVPMSPTKNRRKRVFGSVQLQPNSMEIVWQVAETLP